MIKKIGGLLLALALIIPGIIMPSDTVSAQTLGELVKELEALEEQMRQSQEQKELTEEQINQIYANIDSINARINELHATKITLREEIEALNIEIAKKDREIKDIINFLQISSGESAYLEYAFGAKDFTDFIYRVAVSEQLANYNQNLMTKYNQMIEDNKQKTKELEATEVELNQKQEQLREELLKLGSQLNNILEEQLSLDDDIKLQKETIQLYRDLGCKDDDDIKTCANDRLPPGTALFRPLVKGHVSSNFGNRCYTLNGKWVCDWHSGTDVTLWSDADVPVYAAGRGMVAAISYYNSCGGNMIFIHHNINGATYTTVYMHLRAVLVEKGDVVDKDTQIGIMGGSPSKEYWDTCSNGEHLHFTIATGLYYKDYFYWSDLMAHTFDPKTIVNFPSNDWDYFYDRLTKYN